MSIKKLFNKAKTGDKQSVLSPSTFADLGDRVESEEQITEAITNAKQFIANVDYSDPANFVRFGSAKQYYEDAFNFIANEYPYDGSSQEKLAFSNGLNPLERYIFDDRYPRSTGYVTIGQTYGTQGAPTSGYTLPTSVEYIAVKGGPHAATALRSDQTPDFINGKPNVWDTTKSRTNNLGFGGSDGSTIEFFLKKPTFDSSLSSPTEVVLDVWNSELSSSTSYGRLTIEIQSGSAGNLYVTAQSGTAGVYQAALDTGLATIADNAWHHHAVSIDNSGASLSLKYYLDGTCVGSPVLSGTAIEGVEGAIIGNIGALRAAPSGAAGVVIGAGKLSASLDEVRVWKTERTPEQIGRNWFTNINGGSNTTDSNSSLGVYFKFNEGITGDATTDSVVLDYSGRISNGAWTGYAQAARSTDSAIVESAAAPFERSDLIIYPSHPDVSTLKTTLTTEGQEYDYHNNAGMLHSMPAWIVEDDEQNSGQLKQLTQIMSSYFDTLSNQIDALSKIRDINYVTGSSKPLPFMDRLVSSMGMETPEIFENADVISRFLNRDDKKEFEADLVETKNLIYKNIYNNLNYIYKTKGTEKSFRNFMRCYGIDDELVKLNVYADGINFNLNPSLNTSVSKKRYVDMSGLRNYDDMEATIYQYPNGGETHGLITGSASSEEFAFSLQADIIFPQRRDVNDPLYISPLDVTSSLFGWHTPADPDPTSTDLTWETPANDWGLQVYTRRDFTDYSEIIRSKKDSNDAQFIVADARGNIILSSSVVHNLYDNSRWNVSLNIRPSAYPFAERVTGAENGTYTVDLYAVTSELGSKQQTISATTTVPYATGSQALMTSKRVYVGADRTNHSGTYAYPTDIKVSSVRAWNKQLTTAEVDAHSLEADSFGAEHPYKNTQALQVSSSGGHIPEIETLILNWDFKTAAATDVSGRFTVQDFSAGLASGSYEGSYQGNFADMTLRNHPARGEFFTASDNPARKEYVLTGKQRQLDEMNSQDMIKVVEPGSTDEIFGRDVLPERFFFAVEKSMYDAISSEMLGMFASIKDFNNILGEPKNKYRREYKEMEKLREIFYRRIDSTGDVDKYINYYKWIDGSLNQMIEQLFPISARVSDGVRNVVESHVLERSKYEHKFPTLEMKQTDPESAAKGIGESLYRWSDGHAPISQDQDENCRWWGDRAERAGSLITSGDADIDADREAIKDIANREVGGSTYASRRLSRPVRLNIEQNSDLTPGSNEQSGKKKDIYTLVASDFIEAEKCIDIINPNQKEKMHFKAVIDGTGYKGNRVAPFTAFSSSVTTGYRSVLESAGLTGVDLSSLHEDFTATSEYEAGLQGVYGATHVGGLHSRHVAFGETERAEAWTLAPAAAQITSTRNIASTAPFGGYRRNLGIKSPVSTANIAHKSVGGSIRVLGNHTQDRNYEVIHTSDRSINNLDFVSDPSKYNITGIASPYVGQLVDYAIPQRDTNKTVMVQRFSSPGGVDVNTPAYMDLLSQQYAPNNALPFRNRTVRLANQAVLGTYAGRFGFIDGLGDALLAGGYTIEQLNTGSFPVGVASLHKIQRNTLPYATKTIKDNAFVSRPIPQADRSSWFMSMSGSDASWLEVGGTAGYGLNRSLYDEFAANQGRYPDSAISGGFGVAIPQTSDLTGLSVIGSPFSDYRDDETSAFTRETDGRITYKWSRNYAGAPWHRMNFGQTALGSSYRRSNQFDIIRTSERRSTTTSLTEPVISQNHGMSRTTLTILDDLGEQKNILLEYADGNDRMGFANAELNEYVGYSKVDYRNTFDTLIEVMEDGLPPEVTSIVGIKEHKISQVVYPQARNAGLLSHIKRDVYGINFWKDDDTTRVNKTAVNDFSSSYDVAAGRDAYSKMFPRLTAPFTTSQGYVLMSEVQAPYDSTLMLTPSFDGAGSIWALDSFMLSSYESGTVPDTQPLTLLPPVSGTSPLAAAEISPSGELMGVLYNTKDHSAAMPGSTGLSDYGVLYGKTSALYLFTAPTSEFLLASSVGTQFPNTIGGTPTRPSWSAPQSRAVVSGDLISTPLPARYPYTDNEKTKDEIVTLGKRQGRTLIPEYKSGEYYEKRIKPGTSMFNGDMFSLTGSSLNPTGSVITSDYITSLASLSANRDKLGLPTDIELKATTQNKLTIDNSFYPVQRCLDIAAEFSQSFAPTAIFPTSGSYSAEALCSDVLGWTAPGDFAITVVNNIAWQSTITPLFAPGILFNSIKSGIAVDSPVRISGSSEDQFILDFDGTEHPTNPLFGGLTGTLDQSLFPSLPSPDEVTPVSQKMFYGKRIKFDDLLNPQTFFNKNSIKNPSTNYHVGLGVGTSTGVTLVMPDYGSAIITEKKGDKYNKMVSNFLGATPSFFLDDGMTKISTDPNRVNPESIAVNSNYVYAMEIVLRKTDNFNMYSNPYAFGPPTATGSSGWDTANSLTAHYQTSSIGTPPGDSWPYHHGEFAPYTPPYYYGESIARIVYRPPVATGGAATTVTTLNEIIANSEITYHNSNDYKFDYTDAHRVPPYGWNRAWQNKMKIDASVVIDNKHAGGTPTDRWVIMPRWECPILDFPRTDAQAEASSSLKYNFSASIAPGEFIDGDSPPHTFGMWHQYGVDPSGSEGVHLLIRDVPVNAVMPALSAPNSAPDPSVAPAVELDTSAGTMTTGVTYYYTYKYFTDEKIIDAGSQTIVIPSGSTNPAPVSDPVYIDSSYVSCSVQIAIPTASCPRVVGRLVFEGTTAGNTPNDPLPVNPFKLLVTINDNETEAFTHDGTFVTSSLGTGSYDSSATFMGYYDPNYYKLSEADRATGEVHSLADLVGFQNKGNPQKLGALAESKTVSEAIIAVPYYEGSNDEARFIEIPMYDVAGNVVDTFGPAVARMRESIAKYNLPPSLEKKMSYLVSPHYPQIRDFPNSQRPTTHNVGEDKPIAMYLFEFSTVLDKQDLADIWQGIMPDAADKLLSSGTDTTVSTIDHAMPGLGLQDFSKGKIDNRLRDMIDISRSVIGSGEADAPGFREDIQWMVFKVKQRAPATYEEMVRGNLIDAGVEMTKESGQHEYKNRVKGYNWPFDNFSLVELAKIEASIKWKPEVKEISGPRKDD